MRSQSYFSDCDSLGEMIIRLKELALSNPDYSIPILISLYLIKEAIEVR